MSLSTSRRLAVSCSLLAVCLLAAAAPARGASCDLTVLYAEDFETGSGLKDWTLGRPSHVPRPQKTAGWRGIQACPAHSGARIFRFGGTTCRGVYPPDQWGFARPRGAGGIAVPAESLETRLSFWHRWGFVLAGDDSGKLWLSVDGGPDYDVPGSAIIGGAGYTPGAFAFTGVQDAFVESVVDLDAVCDYATGGAGGCAGRTLRIGFNALTSPDDDRSLGWILDDVAVTACTLHGCTGAPAIQSAAAAGDNQIQVSWSDGAPSSSAFAVYRAVGSCAAPGPFKRIAGPLGGASYLDAAVSGGTTYAYRVAGLNASGFCQSDLSGCVEATATGPCTLPPAFAGLAAVADAATADCALELSWPAAAARCGGPVTYDVYRSTEPDFVPEPATLLVGGIAGTSWDDTSPLTRGTTYYYLVRATDAANGAQDGNLVRRAAAPSGPLTAKWTLEETFEGARSGGGFDHDGWSHAALSGASEWQWTDLNAKSPTHSWHAPIVGAAGDRALVSPPFTVYPDTTLSFIHAHLSDPVCEDGATLEVSTDGGASWSVLPDAAFLQGGFNATLDAGTPNPIAGLRGWCSFVDWTEVRAGLGAFAGLDARLRWRSGEAGFDTITGWVVDSVTLANAGLGGHCAPALPPAGSLHTLTPCRLVDTRDPAGPRGGPALQPGALRSFALAGSCGVPPTARALSVNLTVTQPAAAGHLTLYPGGQTAPSTSSINFQAGQTRANNAILALGPDGALRVLATSSGPVHFILDVNGWFE